ncbi:hypothetical protein IWX88_001463 [Frigoribacterium sp. CG_9.8]|nr:hypothetical protein [Frigoribacterium sp. CG_9.8]
MVSHALVAGPDVSLHSQPALAITAFSAERSPSAISSEHPVLVSSGTSLFGLLRSALIRWVRPVSAVVAGRAPH